MKREGTLSSELLYLKRTSPKNGLTGYYIAPDIGAYRSTLSGSYLSQTLIPPDEGVAAFESRPIEDQYLKPWDRGDYQRLNLEDIDPDTQQRQITNARATTKLLPWIPLNELDGRDKDTPLLT